MKKELALMFIVLVGAAGAGQINPAGDLEYLGAFKIPSEITASQMTFYPHGNPNNSDSYPGSLMISAVGGVLREVSIPVPVISTGKNELASASLLKEASDITGGAVDGSYTGHRLGGIQYLPKQGTQTEDKLYWARHKPYVSGEEYYLGCIDIDLEPSSIAGLWQLENYQDRYNSQYIFEIPKNWADMYVQGKYLVAGRYRSGGNAGSEGPTLFAYAPWEHGNPPTNEAQLDTTVLLKYEEENESLANFSTNDAWSDGAWIEAGNSSAVIIAGSKCSNHGYYSNEYYPDACNDNSGYHSWGCYAAMLFYDPDKLAEVAQGLINDYEVQPYAMMQLENFAFDDHWCKQRGSLIGGIGYDRENNFLYLAEPGADVIHVFSVSTSEQDTDTSIPQMFTANASLDGDNVIIEWTPAIDDSGKVFYIVYRRNLPIEHYSKLTYEGYPIYSESAYSPILVTKETQFVDVRAKDFHPPYHYRIEAHDIVNNLRKVDVTVHTLPCCNGTTTECSNCSICTFEIEPFDNIVEMSELTMAVSQWMQGLTPITDVMETIRDWKSGC